MMNYATIAACEQAHPSMAVVANADGTFSPIDPPNMTTTIEDITSWQLTQALIEVDMINAVESMVTTTTNPLIKYGWEKATTYSRYDPVVLAAQVILNLSDIQVDDLFKLAASK